MSFIVNYEKNYRQDDEAGLKNKHPEPTAIMNVLNAVLQKQKKATQ